MSFFPTSDLQSSSLRDEPVLLVASIMELENSQHFKKISLGLYLNFHFKKNAPFTTTVELNVVVFKNTQSPLNQNQQIFSKYLQCTRCCLSKAFALTILYVCVSGFLVYN